MVSMKPKNSIRVGQKSMGSHVAALLFTEHFCYEKDDDGASESSSQE
jgi:hypothetical protein